MEKNKKYLLISILALIVIVLGITGTYAWYVWSTSDDEQTKIVTNVGAAVVYFDAGSDITGTLKPVDSKEKGILKEINIRSDATSGLVFNLYLEITSLAEELKHESFRFQIYKDDILLKDGNFSQSYLNENLNTETNQITLLSNRSIKSTISTYKLYIWIDGENYTNPSSMQNKSFSFKLHADGEDAIIQEGLIPDISQTAGNLNTISNKIIADYYYADKTTVTNNGVAYYYDTDNMLVSDIDGNIRYYGVNPKNYVYFNCETYPETNCEVWRIIGIFDGKAKLVKDESIGSLAWDQDKNQDSSKTTYSNKWETSSLQEFLNGLYYNRGTTTTHDYYSGSTGTSITTLNLETIGIKESTREMISDTVWYLGGYTSADGLYPNQVYEYERTNEVGTTIRNGYPLTITAKIGLMNASDYAYSADLSKCGSDFLNYTNPTEASFECRATSWLNKGTNVWLLNIKPNASGSIWTIETKGGIGPGSPVYNNQRAVHPVVHLTSEIVIKSGSGTSDDPYRIGEDTTA